VAKGAEDRCADRAWPYDHSPLKHAREGELSHSGLESAENTTLTVVKSTMTAPMVWLSVISTLIVVLETFLFARGSGARLGTLNHERTVINDEFPISYCGIITHNAPSLF
jgi:hypothetical protein